MLGEDDAAEAEEEPLYGAAYLPRKFKIGLAHPADNTIDVLANDLGLIAEVVDGQVTGWILCVGGGHGMTHNKPQTYPRLATPVARVGRRTCCAPCRPWWRCSAISGTARTGGGRG